MSLHWNVLVVAFFLVGGCSDRNSEKSPKANTPNGDGINIDGDGTYFGAITRCLQKVERRIEQKQFMRWSYKCSPIMTDKSRDSLRTQLEAWHKENCPATVTYPMPMSDASGRKCVVNAAMYTNIAFPKSKLEEQMAAPGTCGSIDDETSISPNAQMHSGMLTCSYNR